MFGMQQIFVERARVLVHYVAFVGCRLERGISEHCDQTRRCAYEDVGCEATPFVARIRNGRQESW